MTKTEKIIKLAYSKGYRVTEDGVLHGLRANRIKIKNRGKKRYPTFSVNCGKLTSSGTYGVPVHQFAAYCFYGDEVFDPNLVVRHLDGDTLNIKKTNIVMGTYSDNENDKPKEIKSNASKVARAAQGKRPVNSFFTDNEVRTIRRSFDNGESQADIAERYSVSRNVIHNIIKRKNYGDVV